MGKVRMGVPETIVRDIALHYDIDVFVESGTYRADTAFWASGVFKKVYTIEADKTLYDAAKNKHPNIDNIEFLYGNSRDRLSTIVSELHDNNERAIFWLDAHWSGGETYGEQDECPLLDELAIILGSNLDHIILVDDARLFLAPPPLPHDAEAWPGIGNIATLISANAYDTIILDDVIFCFPMMETNYFRSLFQDITTSAAMHSDGGVFGLVSHALRKMKKSL